jgi:phosphodiesterase/alkaline phosphatase D-like protein/peptidoglycan hydrolase-like protein with peptidoglycan-binding domain
MKKIRLLASVCLAVSMTFFTIAPAFAQLGDVTPPPVVEPTPPPAPPTPPPITDLCPNIDGAQASIPTGMIIDGSGNCVTPIPADTTAPVISGVANASVSDIAATIVWTTDEAAVSTFQYGTTSSYGSSATLPAGALLAHTAVLTGLTPNTTYYYCIHATDLSTNTSNACGQTFTTAAVTDATPPIVSVVVGASVNSTSETITWTTGEAATSQVEYGTSETYGSQTTLNSSLSLTHSQTLTGLTPETLYHYRVLSKDAAGNLTTSSDYTFTTAAVSISGGVSDTTPPVVSSVGESELGSNTALLVWTTNELATSTLEYGTTINYGFQAQLEPDALLAHSAALVNLSPSTAYYYCIHATDLFNNTSNSCGHQFTTEAASSAPIVSGDTTPPVISSVADASITDAAATIVWTTDELATSTLEYGTTTGYGSQATLDASMLLSHTATLSNLSPNTTYYYCIHATDLAGNTANDCGKTFTTAHLSSDVTPPTLYVVAAASVSQTSETISWTTSELADGQVEYGTDTNYGSTSNLNSTLALTHSQTLSSLTAGTTYHYRVLSKDSFGNLTTSPDYTFTTESASLNISPSDTTPPVISGVANSSLGSNTATLVWSTNELAVSTLEYGTTSSYGSSATLSASALLDHTAILTNLSPNTTYYYCIRATDVAGNTASSCGHSFTTETANSAPQQLTDITAPLITSSYITASTTTATVSWTTDEAANSQVEYGATTSYGSQTSLDTNLETAHTVTITGLTASTEYHYQIVTTDSAGNTTVSGDNTFTTPAIAAPVVLNQNNVPAAPIVSGVTQISNSPESIIITWLTDQPADSQIEYGLASSYGSSSNLNSSLTTAHSVTLTGLNPSTEYHYKIKSKNSAGSYAVTSDGNFTTLAAPVPAPVISLVNTTVTQTGATVTWTTNIPSDSHIEYGLNTAYDNQTSEDTSLVTLHSQTISNLAPGTTYDFRVLSQAAGGDEAVSTNHTFTTQAALVSGSSNSQNPNQALPPTAVTSVWTSDVEQTAVTVNFSIPNTGQNEALQYDIRYSTAPITDSNFSAATPVEVTPVYFDFPQSGQTANNQYVVLGLNPNTEYYFAIKTKNQSGQVSGISQTVSATTLASSGNNNSSNQITENLSVNTSGSSVSSGGGGGGSYYIGGINPPANLRAAAADSSAILFWDNPTDPNFVRVQVVRSTSGYPTTVNDGQIIYEGNRTGFTDANLSNGQKYYYSIFFLNHLSYISAPLQFSVTPQGGTQQVSLLKHPGIVSSCGVDLSYGMKSDAVRQLQEYLDNLEPITYPPKLITGYFHKYTLAAVKQLQAQYGLPETGVWDAATRAAVGMCFGNSLQASLSRDLQAGMSGNDVEFLQQYLINQNLLGSQYATGYFGPLTKAAVIQFQQKNNIQPANGYVGAATRTVMNNQ